MIDHESWLPCGMCGRCYESCTCQSWLDPVKRRRMERDVKARHQAAVALAASRMPILRRQAA